MATQANPPLISNRSWHILSRWQEYSGEQRANLLRLVGVFLFYGVELLNRHGLQVGSWQIPAVADVTPQFHQAITALVIAWALVCLGTWFCLSNQIFPSVLKFVTCGCDVVLLTCALMLADGPRSPLVTGYFLIIALSSMRFSLFLVRFTTVASLIGYLWINGYVRWYGNEAFRIPRHQQIIVLLALALCGIIVGQVIRRVQGLAEEYAAFRTARSSEIK